ncbi:nuclear transport factor 2 family protein [Modestobacter sp. VKM Ac-2983]|uniref:nuclear transport factor 2 family protein n=1 Tax=Modestobacter sp. VKM Ac-2983 TaxID=3004137 RepID=UPI0022AB9A95|nr:nuclear transport factor 2 family protein [Modestobacter sp. VKM Ac-2983]MCZ2805548.1 nuclear transport factor 2 family protein [Modestobacter sp. VKM Ac-2983]
MQQAEQDLTLVREVYTAFERADVPRIMALFADDGTVTQSPELPWGGVHVGHEGLGHFLATLTGHLDSHPETERLFADGSGHVVQVGRTRGVVRATGAPFDVPEVHVLTVSGGRVQCFEAYLDTAAMRAALAAPAPVPAGT